MPIDPLSKAEFGKVLTRALALDQASEELIDVSQAEAVAAELGVSRASWEAALAELRATRPSVRERFLLGVWRRPALFAIATFAFGALWSVSRRGFELPSAWDRPLVLLVLGTALWVGRQSLRRGALRQYLREMVGYWAGLPFGFAVGFGGDGLWFSLAAWALCAVIGLLAARRDQLAAVSRSVTSGGAP